MAEITQDDVKLLYSDATPERRAVLAQKVAHHITYKSLSPTELDLAIAICTKLAEDVDVVVRQSLSEAIKTSTDIPKELAYKLARDVLDVSLPLLEFNELLDDEALIPIIKQGNAQQQLAIAKRPRLSPELTYSLCQKGNEQVVETALKNEGAEFKDQTYDLVLNRFNQSPLIHSSLANRSQLPPYIIERMIDLVGDHIKAQLVQRHPLSAVAMERLILESKEDAKQRLLQDPFSKREADYLVQALARQDKLSNELIIRALEIGDRPFFEYALAYRVAIPVENARTLIKDKGDKGFRALYQQARLPEEEYQAINYMVEIEYHNARNRAITSQSERPTRRREPESWLTKTEKPKKKWRLF
ncbi:DUF2336 domain-containing protein [Terasakiella sp. SH-1]|uniref:DUF2336 domain-containing protein n=1 Tax=Terasakiella sp. SH-1 TaxID=2560057 RepID=UPI00107435D4|nr:DUF2336 domain-containing protein [Terasakiella sp. SH-1]